MARICGALSTNASHSDVFPRIAPSSVTGLLMGAGAVNAGFADFAEPGTALAAGFAIAGLRPGAGPERRLWSAVRLT